MPKSLGWSMIRWLDYITTRVRSGAENCIHWSIDSTGTPTPATTHVFDVPHRKTFTVVSEYFQVLINTVYDNIGNFMEYFEFPDDWFLLIFQIQSSVRYKRGKVIATPHSGSGTIFVQKEYTYMYSTPGTAQPAVRLGEDGHSIYMASLFDVLCTGCWYKHQDRRRIIKDNMYKHIVVSAHYVSQSKSTGYKFYVTRP